MTPKQHIECATDHHNTMTVIGAPKPGPKAKKAKNPPIDKEAFIQRRYGILPHGWVVKCDCGCGDAGHDLHHCFIGRKKGYPILDDDRNLVVVNHYEHIDRKFDTRAYRIWFWNRQCRFYGVASMMDWVNCLPPKMRDRIDWL